MKGYTKFDGPIASESEECLSLCMNMIILIEYWIWKKPTIVDDVTNTFVTLYECLPSWNHISKFVADK